jgi:hypothetical protein
MYDKTDPRAALSSASASPKVFSGQGFGPPQYGRFHDSEPVETAFDARNWYIRGANFVLCYSETDPGAVFERHDQADEYVLLIPDAGSKALVVAGREEASVVGPSIVMIPPGPGRVVSLSGGRLVRLFTSRAADLVAKCPNAEAYADGRPEIPPFEPWPAPPDGFRIRAYGLDVPPEPGRFGRIFRCTTFMVNVLDPQTGPRDVRKLSPHHHDDFEQCSLCLEGAFIHHLRWPWTVDMTMWRDDEHQEFGTPSALVIPPPCIHTSRGIDAGRNQLVDIFSPPRHDFSNQKGWVLNAADYPMPAGN